MPAIPLVGSSLLALVDADDFDKLAQSTWRLSSRGYAQGSVREGLRVRPAFMHRVILGIGGHLMVDHLNGDRLDNRRGNLRVVTPSQNAMNRRARGGRVTRFKGVQYLGRGRWRARIGVDGQYRHLGSFGTDQEAAACYDVEARKLFGAFARLNFPLPGEMPAFSTPAATGDHT